jgi:adhesin transport system outer membrane protein
MKYLPISLGLCLLMPLLAQAQATKEVPPILVPAQIPQRGKAMVPLQKLVIAALERSPGTREAQANWRAAVQDVAQARGALWPRVDLNANTAATKLDGGKAAALSGGVGAVASYTLLDFGRTRDQIDAKQSEATSMQARVLLAREATTFDTVNAYLQLVKYQRLISIYESHITDLKDLVSKLSEIVAVFQGRASELTQAQTHLGQARDALSSLHAKKREYQLALLRQVGSALNQSKVEDAIPEFPLEAVPAMLAEASKSHPSIVSARADAASAKALAAEAHAAREPQVEVQVAKQTGKDALGNSYPLQLYVSAKWAAFQGFGDRAAEQALIERAAAAEEKISQLLIEIEFNVNSAWADYEAQASRLDELRNLVRGTDQVRQDYYAQWRDLGRRSLLDVLTAENEYLGTRMSLASSEVDQAVALARLRFEAGTLKEWMVGDDGRAVAVGEPIDRVPAQMLAALPETATVDALNQAAAEYAPAQVGALESSDLQSDDQQPAPQLAQAGDAAG